jgi:hypothetical protein
MAKTKQPAQVYQLKITLKDIQPEIWRQVQMKDCTLAKLHDIIQTCIGWGNHHLHEFEIGNERYGDPAQWQDDLGVGKEGKIKLSKLISQMVKRFL